MSVIKQLTMSSNKWHLTGGNGQAEPLKRIPTKAQRWADCIYNNVASREYELPLVGEVFGVALKCTTDEVGEPFVIIA